MKERNAIRTFQRKRLSATTLLLFSGRERTTQMGSFLVPDADVLRPLRLDASRHRASGTQVFRYIGSHKSETKESPNIGDIVETLSPVYPSIVDAYSPLLELTNERTRCSQKDLLIRRHESARVRTHPRV